jgi:hypothetical protein
LLLFPLPPQAILFRPSYFSLEIKVWFYHGSRLLFMHYLPFPWPINYDRAFWCHKSPTHSLSIRFGWKSLLFSLEIMASHMATSYGPQATQVNKESAAESSLDLMLT